MISPALQSLYDEHDHILAAVDRLQELLQDPQLPARGADVAQLLEFFREYGDGFHHQKEEAVLFPRLAQRHAGMEMLVESLTEHHALFRETLGRAGSALAAGSWEEVARSLRGYATDLLAHISAENDELFVAADDVLSDDEKERLVGAFADADRERGLEAKARWERAIA